MFKRNLILFSPNKFSFCDGSKLFFAGSDRSGSGDGDGHASSESDDGVLVEPVITTRPLSPTPRPVDSSSRHPSPPAESNSRHRPRVSTSSRKIFSVDRDGTFSGPEPSSFRPPPPSPAFPSGHRPRRAAFLDGRHLDTEPPPTEPSMRTDDGGGKKERPSAVEGITNSPEHLDHEDIDSDNLSIHSEDDDYQSDLDSDSDDRYRRRRASYDKDDSDSEDEDYNEHQEDQSEETSDIITYAFIAAVACLFISMTFLLLIATNLIPIASLGFASLGLSQMAMGIGAFCALSLGAVAFLGNALAVYRHRIKENPKEDKLIFDGTNPGRNPKNNPEINPENNPIADHDDSAIASKPSSSPFPESSRPVDKNRFKRLVGERHERVSTDRGR